MRNKIVSYSALLFLLLFAWGCNKTYDPTPEHVSKIFPIEDGKQRIYYVVDTVYATTNSQLFEERIYYKKEVTDGTEFDLLDREVSKLWVYNSPDSLGSSYSWTFDELWTQYKGDDYSERIEGNTRYLVLKNPAYGDASWNGNLFNSLEQRTYRYANIDTTVILNGVEYQNCVFVMQQEYYQPVLDSNSTIFIVEHAYEIYAPGIGKIMRYFKDFEIQSGTIDPQSRIYREVLVDHNYD